MLHFQQAAPSRFESRSSFLHPAGCGSRCDSVAVFMWYGLRVIF
jgi:hypothetical protein